MYFKFKTIVFALLIYFNVKLRCQRNKGDCKCLNNSEQTNTYMTIYLTCSLNQIRGKGGELNVKRIVCKDNAYICNGSKICVKEVNLSPYIMEESVANLIYTNSYVTVLELMYLFLLIVRICRRKMVSRDKKRYLCVYAIELIYPLSLRVRNNKARLIKRAHLNDNLNCTNGMDKESILIYIYGLQNVVWLQPIFCGNLHNLGLYP